MQITFRQSGSYLRLFSSILLIFVILVFIKINQTPEEKKKRRPAFFSSSNVDARRNEFLYYKQFSFTPMY